MECNTGLMQTFGVVRSWGVRSIALASLLALQLTGGSLGPASGPPVARAAAAQPAPMCFTETGFCIADPAFQTYFTQRGGTRILGFPISREFTLDGFSVQFFQRVILQLQSGGVSRLNVLSSAWRSASCRRAGGSVP